MSGSTNARRYKSDPFPLAGVADPFEQAVGDLGRTHCFIGLEFYNAATGLDADQVEPTAGTFSVRIKTSVLPNTDTPIPDAAVDLGVENDVITCDAPLTAVVISGLGTVTGATHFRVIVSMHGV